MVVSIPDDIVETSLQFAHQLIHELKQRDPDNSTFDQVGLLGGRTIALEYLQYGEVGLALEHLLYMIHEADIGFPRERVVQLHAMAANDKLFVNHYSSERLAALSPEQREFVYNAL